MGRRRHRLALRLCRHGRLPPCLRIPEHRGAHDADDVQGLARNAWREARCQRGPLARLADAAGGHGEGGGKGLAGCVPGICNV